MPTVRSLLVGLLIAVCLLGCADDGFDDEIDVDDADSNSAEQLSEEDDNDLAVATSDEPFGEWVATRVQDDNIPGLAAAVVTGNDILFMQGFGLRDIEANLPVTEETLFHIGSTNKSMTALLIATLVDDGYLEWDEPIVTFYPDFEMADPDSTGTVTIRHLLSMSSGISEDAEDDFDLDDSADNIIPFAASAELVGAPEEEFNYSNLSAALAGYLGVVAESGSDRNVYDGYARLLQERVLAPSGMQDAVVRVSEARRNPNYGRSYTVAGGEAVEAEPYDVDGDPLAPSGTVKANVRDMARYIQMQLNEGVAYDGTRVVSAENLTETWRPVLDQYGMGWETHTIDGVTVILHEGAWDTYLSVIGFMPDANIGFVLLANSEDTAEELLADAPAKIVELFAK